MQRIDIIDELNNSIKYITEKERIIFPKIVDIHPVSGKCNLNCTWCIGKKGYKKDSPLDDKFNLENIYTLVNNILNDNYREHLPLEFHICGCDSEPLIKEREVAVLIKELKKRNRTVELITNGLLINEKNIKDLIQLDKISFSMDVVNDEDFLNYKINNPYGMKNGFTKIMNNIKLLSEEKKCSNSNVSIYVTFVATPETFEYNKWKELFEFLKSIGVNHIQVRSDINEVYGTFDNLKSYIDKIAINMKANIINYEDENHFDIKYHSPDSPVTSGKRFEHCISPYFWPAIGMDLKLYRCAHTALSVYNSFLDLTNGCFYKYYTDFKNNTELVKKIGCAQKCPPTLSRINSKFYIESENENI